MHELRKDTVRHDLPAKEERQQEEGLPHSSQPYASASEKVDLRPTEGQPPHEGARLMTAPKGAICITGSLSASGYHTTGMHASGRHLTSP
jgi:hypothetical protein